jgi:hypothetical protein
MRASHAAAWRRPGRAAAGVSSGTSAGVASADCAAVIAPGRAGHGRGPNAGCPSGWGRILARRGRGGALGDAGRSMCADFARARGARCAERGALIPVSQRPGFPLTALPGPAARSAGPGCCAAARPEPDVQRRRGRRHGNGAGSCAIARVGPARARSRSGAARAGGGAGGPPGRRVDAERPPPRGWGGRQRRRGPGQVLAGARPQLRPAAPRRRRAASAASRPRVLPRARPIGHPPAV